MEITVYDYFSLSHFKSKRHEDLSPLNLTFTLRFEKRIINQDLKKKIFKYRCATI